MFIQSAAEAIRQGKLSPVALLDRCLDRIDRYEERVRAWVVVDRDGAKQQARRAEAEIKAGHWRGPLHGIPIGVKDIIDVFDLPTAAGSRLWKDSVARQDATVVRRLRSAGAVIMGKTVTTQYASFDPPPTRNPWKASRTPGGSSSGSAAAVACGMCLGALATQTGGSITRPASYCGAASIKPSFGRVSTQGVLPLAHSMDHIGTMAGCVRDVRTIFQAMAGTDPLDAERELSYVDQAEPLSPGAPRLGRVHALFATLAEPAVTALVDRAVAVLEKKGAKVKDVALPGSFDEVLTRHRTVMAVEAAQYHEDRLRRHPEDYSPCITQLLNEGLACTAPEYARTKEHQKLLSLEVASTIAPGEVLLTPATTSAAPDAATTGNPAFNSPWSYTGLPTVSFVAGWTDDGLPLALQLIGRPNTESELLAIAEWCEEALAVSRREPS
jgi:aspartyl-tRNA(Asn)/glutamyl-tRNA(Gln) amidotransferase subunit A